ncbi:MAG: glycosyltransferase family 25 protein [Bacteroidales bacterium]
MLGELGIDGVYVIHAKNGYELQEKYVQKLFADLRIDFEFASDGDVSSFSTLDVHSYFVDSIFTRLKETTISCTLNHLLAYEKIQQRGHNLALIFEDDPVFIGDFYKKMKRVIREAQTLEPGFIISLEGTTLKYPSIWDTKKGTYLYKALKGRCAGAYVIDKKAVHDVVEFLHTYTCSDPIDIWHNILIEKNIIDMYWAHPVLVEQASHNGLMSSLISTRVSSNRRRIAWVLQKMLKYFFRRLFPRKEIVKN